MARTGLVGNIAGDFGPFGQQSFNPDALTGPSSGDRRLPPEPWAAVRTLVEGTPVTLTLAGSPARRRDHAHRARAPAISTTPARWRACSSPAS